MKCMKISRLVLLVNLFLGLAFAETGKPNIVFFLVDDLGWSGVIYVLVYTASILVIFKNKRVHDFIDRSLDLDEPT